MTRASAARMGRLLLGLTVLALVLPNFAEAQAKGKKARKSPPPRVMPALSGPIPPLPATTVTFTVEVTEADADLFAWTGSSAPEDVAPMITGAWTLGDWRRQLHDDILTLESIRDQLAVKYEDMQTRSFPVAVRYLKGIHDAVAELMRLSWKARDDFDLAISRDRLTEAAPEPPIEARRVRLYLDRARGLEVSTDQFLTRAVEGASQRVERIAQDD